MEECKNKPQKLLLLMPRMDELATDRCKIESHNLWIKSGFGHALSALVPCTLDHAL